MEIFFFQKINGKIFFAKKRKLGNFFFETEIVSVFKKNSFFFVFKEK